MTVFGDCCFGSLMAERLPFHCTAPTNDWQCQGIFEPIVTAQHGNLCSGDVNLNETFPHLHWGLKTHCLLLLPHTFYSFHAFPPNKSLSHIIRSWHLLLGGPKVTQRYEDGIMTEVKKQWLSPRDRYFDLWDFRLPTLGRGSECFSFASVDRKSVSV